MGLMYEIPAFKEAEQNKKEFEIANGIQLSPNEEIILKKLQKKIDLKIDKIW